MRATLGLFGFVILGGCGGSAGGETGTTGSAVTTATTATTDGTDTMVEPTTAATGTTETTAAPTSTGSSGGSSTTGMTGETGTTGTTGPAIDCEAISDGPFTPTLYLSGYKGSEDLAFDGQGGLVLKRDGQVVIVRADQSLSLIHISEPTRPY